MTYKLNVIYPDGKVNAIQGEGTDAIKLLSALVRDTKAAGVFEFLRAECWYWIENPNDGDASCWIRQWEVSID